jgi:probable rRNA maturation factor
LDLSVGSRRPWVPTARAVNSWALAALGPLGKSKLPQSWVLSVRVVGKTASRSLNAAYRRKDKPTNVLSFAGAGLSPEGRYYLGELVICAAVVASEATAQHKTLPSHWAHMVVHGVLHLRGLDHEVAVEAAKMESAEVQILDRLGFSDPYR